MRGIYLNFICFVKDLRSFFNIYNVMKYFTKQPNCHSKIETIHGKKHIMILAKRKLLQGEELTYDYKFPLEEDKITCHCLSRKCRKYLN